jgi:hypothetical protein
MRHSSGDDACGSKYAAGSESLMPPRRAGRAIVVTVFVLLVAGAIGLAATGKLPVFKRTVATIASSVASSVSAVTAPDDASSQGADAGPDATGSNVVVHRQAGPLSSAQLGAPLVHGAFVVACGAPDDMKVVVKAAVRMGHAVHVTVKTEPPNPTVASCVERATHDLRWDISPKTGRVTVTY